MYIPEKCREEFVAAQARRDNFMKNFVVEEEEEEAQ